MYVRKAAGEKIRRLIVCFQGRFIETVCISHVPPRISSIYSKLHQDMLYLRYRQKHAIEHSNSNSVTGAFKMYATR